MNNSADYFQDIEDPEYAQTKAEWEEIQTRFALMPDNSLAALSDAEQIEFDAEMNTLNASAVSYTIRTLISRHPVEFLSILKTERDKRGIGGTFFTDLDGTISALEVNT